MGRCSGGFFRLLRFNWAYWATTFLCDTKVENPKTFDPRDPAFVRWQPRVAAPLHGRPGCRPTDAGAWTAMATAPSFDRHGRYRLLGSFSCMDVTDSGSSIRSVPRRDGWYVAANSRRVQSPRMIDRAFNRPLMPVNAPGRSVSVGDSYFSFNSCNPYNLNLAATPFPLCSLENHCLAQKRWVMLRSPIVAILPRTIIQRNAGRPASTGLKVMRWFQFSIAVCIYRCVLCLI